MYVPEDNYCRSVVNVLGRPLPSAAVSSHPNLNLVHNIPSTIKVYLGACTRYLYYRQLYLARRIATQTEALMRLGGKAIAHLAYVSYLVPGTVF